MHVVLYDTQFYYAAGNKLLDEKRRTIEVPDWKLKVLPPLCRRFVRARIFDVQKYGSYVIVVVRRRILVFHEQELLHQVKIERGSRPLKNGVALCGGKLYFGDYWSNADREAVNLYQVDLSSGEKRVVYQFDWVRHIHFVQKDESGPGALLIGTGDYDSESGIYRYHIPTGQLEVLFEGSQTYRAVSLLSTADALLWGSDDPDGENYIYRYDGSTKKVEGLRKIDGPAYYSTKNRSGVLFIATTVERRGAHRAVIYASKDGGRTWDPYREFKKDRWHWKYFGYGVVEFIQGQDKLEELQYNLIGLKETR